MKFIWQSEIISVNDHQPILSGKKVGNDTIFEYGQKVKRITTSENIAFQYEGEDGPQPGTKVRITIETLP